MKIVALLSLMLATGTMCFAQKKATTAKPKATADKAAPKASAAKKTAATKTGGTSRGK